VAHALGWYCYELTLDPDPALKVETGAQVLAYCSTGAKPQSPASGELRGVLDSDRHTAATICVVMAGDWRGALGRLRVLRAATRDLIERNWESIRFLAYELEFCRRLDQDQIENILSGIEIAASVRG
jgi:hypothetical protein